MKIYFAASITGGRDHAALYQGIVEHLKKYGTILTEHIADSNMTSQGEQHDPTFVYNRDMAWLKEADVLVADVSTSSLGVGYEIGKAEQLGKPILCLYFEQQGKVLSRIISGNPRVIVASYKAVEEATVTIDDFFAALHKRPN